MKAIDLRGIWAGIAGVKFPEPTQVKKTRRKPSLKPKLPNPAKWISSTDAAKLAGCTRSFIRSMFRRRKVTRKLHRGEDGVLRAYWKRSVADPIIGVYRGDVCDKKGRRFVNNVPEGYVTYKEAQKRIGCARSSIHRMLLRNQLRSVYVKIEGVHKQRMICAEDVEKVSNSRAKQ